MIFEQVVSTSTWLLIIKVVPALWLAQLLLLAIDRRRSPVKAHLVLSLITLFASLWNATQTLGFSSPIAWWFSSTFAAFVLAYQIRNWIKLSPSEVHEESSQASQSKRPKKNKKRKSHPGPPASNSANASEPISFVGLLILLGLLCAAGGVAIDTNAGGVASLGVNSPESDGESEGVSNQGGSDNRVPIQNTPANSLGLAASLHLFSTAGLLAVAIVEAIELSFFSAPNALNPTVGVKVRWAALSMVGLFIALCDMSAGATIFLQQVDPDSNDLPMQILARVFALTLLVLAGIVWVIAHRVSGFQEKNTEAKGWVSLAISAWIAIFALLIVLSLPSGFPWDLEN